MSRRSVILPFLLSLATAAALLWVLGQRRQPAGAAYDGSGRFLGQNVDMSYVPMPSPVPVYLPAHGTRGFTLHLKSGRAIELIRITSSGASPMPPP